MSYFEEEYEEEYDEDYGGYWSEGERDYGSDIEYDDEKKFEFEEEEQKFSFKDLERAGSSKTTSEFLGGQKIGNIKLQKIQERVESIMESYSQRLEKQLSEYSKKYDIEKTISGIISNYKKIPNNAFLNPLLLILGFLNLKDDKISKTTIEKILKAEKTIKMIHVVRYTNVWSKYLS